MSMQDRLDRQATWLTQRLAERTSRRGLLVRTGKWALAVAGVAALEALPIGPAQIAEANTSCSYYLNCGINGYPCDGCGGGQSSCPGDATDNGASSWNACCCDPITGNQCYSVNYVDCCNNTTYYDPNTGYQVCCATPDFPNNAPNCCGTAFCANNPGSGDWCGSAGQCYKCTIIQVIGSC